VQVWAQINPALASQQESRYTVFVDWRGATNAGSQSPSITTDYIQSAKAA